MGLDVLSIRILFDFLTQGCHTLTPELLAQAPEFEVEDHNYVLICEEELQEIFERQGGKQT